MHTSNHLIIEAYWQYFFKFGFYFFELRVIITDVSDHFGISPRFDLCIPRKSAPIIPKSPMHVFTQSNLQKFEQAIAEVDWNNLVDLTDDINTSFQRFYDKLILWQKHV